MKAKTIKIPKGANRLMFENGSGFIISDAQLWDILTEYHLKMLEPPTEPLSPSEVTYEKVFDDENPDYIKMSQEEI